MTYTIGAGGEVSGDMAERDEPTGALVRPYAVTRGRTRPRVEIWHGTADHTVIPANADHEVLQWTDVHGVGPAPSARDPVKGQPRDLFRAAVRQPSRARTPIGVDPRQAIMSGTLNSINNCAPDLGRNYPLMTPIGLTRATLRESPALCTTSTTTSTSL